MCYTAAQCLSRGRSSTYRGESSRSGRQRHKEHESDLALGVAASPLVIHTVEEHGGVRPRFLYTVGSVEPRPLYRAVRESMEIGSLPPGPENLNRCQEWGTPRVPILSVTGGDEHNNSYMVSGEMNDRMEWTHKTMESVRAGTMKIVRLLSSCPEVEHVADGAQLGGEGPDPAATPGVGPNANSDQPGLQHQPQQQSKHQGRTKRLRTSGPEPGHGAVQHQKRMVQPKLSFSLSKPKDHATTGTTTPATTTGPILSLGIGKSGVTADPAALVTPQMATLGRTGPGAARGAVTQVDPLPKVTIPPTSANPESADLAVLVTSPMPPLEGAGPGTAWVADPGKVTAATNGPKLRFGSRDIRKAYRESYNLDPAPPLVPSCTAPTTCPTIVQDPAPDHDPVPPPPPAPDTGQVHHHGPVPVPTTDPDPGPNVNHNIDNNLGPSLPITAGAAQPLVCPLAADDAHQPGPLLLTTATLRIRSYSQPAKAVAKKTVDPGMKIPGANLRRSQKSSLSAWLATPPRTQGPHTTSGCSGGSLAAQPPPRHPLDLNTSLTDAIILTHPPSKHPAS